MAEQMPEPIDSPNLSSGIDRLDSWKEIAAHLKRDVSTVQRWERKEGLPVHRHRHDKLGSVYAFKTELDVWWNQGRQRIESAESTVPNDAAHAPTTPRTMALDTVGRRIRAAPSWWKPARVIAFGLVLVFFAGVSIGRRSAPSMGADRQVTHTLVTIQPADHLSAIPQDRHPARRRPSRRAIALSPDGRTLVFSAAGGGKQQLYRRALEQEAAITIAGTEGAGIPFFSPDGRWLGFWADGKLKKISVDGGTAVELCAAQPLFGASWGADGVIVFGGRQGLWQVSADGGKPTLLTTIGADEFSHRQPYVLPGANVVLFTVQPRAFRWDDARIEVLRRDTGERKTLLDGGTDARYLATGHLIFVRDAVLLAAPFDVAQTRLTGGPIAIRDGVMHAIGDDSELTDTGAAQIDVSESGTLAFVAGTIYPPDERIPVWVDGRGNVHPLDVPGRDYMGPRLSPDGSRLAVGHSANRRDDDIWIYDLKRGTSVRLTSDGGHAWPIWTHDGRRVAFYAETQGPSNLFWQPVDGSGHAERLTTSIFHQRPASWSPDDKELVFSQGNPKTHGDIWAASINGGQVSSRPVVEGPFDEIFPELSPDGQWLAYASDASGRLEVYVQPYLGPGEKQMISTSGGREPAWARDGRRLFYREPPRDPSGVFRMMAVDVTAHGSAFVAGIPSPLFDDRFVRTSPIRSYDLGPDGRFLMLLDKDRAATPATEIHLVLNWSDELRRTLAAK